MGRRVAAIALIVVCSGLAVRMLLLSLFAASLRQGLGGEVRVRTVIDGDTFVVDADGGNEATIRIIGIDTPETVHPSKPVQCFGKEASNRLRALLEGQTVTLERREEEDTDMYGRFLRYVSLAEKDVGAQMIEEGFAFSFGKYPHARLGAYNGLESSARQAGIGLWGAQCAYASMPPAAGSVAAASPVPGCNIKGNISSSGRLYHLPGCSTYGKTIIDTEDGERWFCTEADAQSAGWRKAGTCE